MNRRQLKMVRHRDRLPNYGCSIPRGIQGQVGWGPGQPELVATLPMAGVGAGWTVQSLSAQTIQ